MSPNDERVCFTCQFSLKRRWKEIASVAPRPPGARQISRCHEVQFYSRDEFFLDRFTRFIGAALKVGKAVVVVATPSHQDSFLQRLRAEGLDVAATMDEGRYIALDVADTLSTFMVNGLPDPARFSEATGSLIASATKAARGEHPPGCGLRRMCAVVVAGGECGSGGATGRTLGRALPGRMVSIFFAATQDETFTANMGVKHSEESLRNTRQFMPGDRDC